MNANYSVPNRIIALALLVILVVLGCGDSPSDDAAKPQTANVATESDLKSKALRADARMFDRAIGANSDLTDVQKSDALKMFRDSPASQNQFLGIWTLQNPSDAWILMEIFWDTKPDLLIETGTFHGGSALLWAIILKQINPDAEVITIDIKDKRERLARKHPVAKERVTFLHGSSTAEKIVAEVHRRAKGKRVMDMLDSLHSKEHVAAELAAYAPLVPLGGYLVVQDTPVGPLAAIDEFLAANPDWKADRERERYPDTVSVKGYLKRVR